MQATRHKLGEEAETEAMEAPVVEPSHWPWTGRVRKYIYFDFFIYALLLITFCVITLVTSAKRPFDSYHLVQSVQTTLLTEVCSC